MKPTYTPYFMYGSEKVDSPFNWDLRDQPIPIFNISCSSSRSNSLVPEQSLESPTKISNKSPQSDRRPSNSPRSNSLAPSASENNLHVLSQAKKTSPGERRRSSSLVPDVLEGLPRRPNKAPQNDRRPSNSPRSNSLVPSTSENNLLSQVNKISPRERRRSSSLVPDVLESLPRRPNRSPQNGRRLSSLDAKEDQYYEPQPDYHTETFDPSEKPHLWSMWRMAVNNQIISKAVEEPKEAESSSKRQRYVARTLTRPPLTDHIKMNSDISNTLRIWMISGDQITNSNLFPGQFIYFGVPRINLEKRKWCRTFETLESFTTLSTAV